MTGCVLVARWGTLPSFVAIHFPALLLVPVCLFSRARLGTLLPASSPHNVEGLPSPRQRTRANVLRLSGQMWRPRPINNQSCYCVKSLRPAAAGRLRRRGPLCDRTPRQDEARLEKSPAALRARGSASAAPRRRPRGRMQLGAPPCRTGPPCVWRLPLRED